MTLILDLEPELEEQLREKAAREGRDVEITARAMLAAALELEELDRQETIDGIKRGLADVAAGRERPFSEFLAEQRAKHGLSETGLRK